MPNLQILIGTSETAMKVRVPTHGTTEDLEQAIFDRNRSLFPGTHKLRFIHRGKLLGQGHILSLPDGAFVHCAVSEHLVIDELGQIETWQSDTTIVIRRENSMVDMDSRGIENGARSEWIYGMATGALLGAIVVVIGNDPTISASKRWQQGVLCGVIVNVAFGIYMLMKGS